MNTVVTDGSHSYRAAIHRYLPRARHVLDRFHAVRWFTGRAHSDTQRTATPPTARSGTEQRRLDRLFAAHPRLRVAWDALQELYGLYQADDLQGALDALQRFADLYETGAIPEYHTTVDTILNWSDEILNWHHSRRSNGPLEGTNNLIQTLRRTAHGFTNPQNYAARGLLLT